MSLYPSSAGSVLSALPKLRLAALDPKSVVDAPESLARDAPVEALARRVPALPRLLTRCSREEHRAVCRVYLPDERNLGRHELAARLLGTPDT